MFLAILATLAALLTATVWQLGLRRFVLKLLAVRPLRTLHTIAGPSPAPNRANYCWPRACVRPAQTIQAVAGRAPCTCTCSSWCQCPRHWELGPAASPCCDAHHLTYLTTHAGCAVRLPRDRFSMESCPICASNNTHRLVSPPAKSNGRPGPRATSGATCSGCGSPAGRPRRTPTAASSPARPGPRSATRSRPRARRCSPARRRRTP